MNQPTATLESDVGLGAPAETSRSVQSPGNRMKFVYKTGSRPLDGFTIKRGVGVGGFGEVYFAVTDAGKEVALKRIQRNLDIEVRGVTQCLNLKHANLISLFDIKYDDEGQAWVVMEFVPGESLKDVVDRNPNGMPVNDADRWFREIASGVAYLHEHGIVHRDLKPANIFDDEGVVKIGDYGLSKFISCSRRSGQTESVGTFHYMAPEIGKGVYGKEIDVYALGIILYEMLTGRVPFDGESSQEIIMKHLTDEPDVSRIPSPYRNVIQQALRKDPRKRYDNVNQMIADLAGEPSESELELADLQIQDPTPNSSAALPSADEPIYIGGEEPEEEIQFGALRDSQVVSAEVVSDGVPPISNPGLRSAYSQQAASTSPGTSNGHGYEPAQEFGQKSTLSGPAKAVLVIGLLLLVVFNPWLIPLGLVIGGVYLVYIVVRSLTGHSSRSRGLRNTKDPHKRFVRFDEDRWRATAREELKAKTIADRGVELTGAMLMSACVAGILCLVLLLVQGGSLDGTATSWSIYAWLAGCSILGSWVLLAAGKFWESSDGDHLQRRILLTFAGLFMGCIAFGFGQFLLVDLPNHDQWTVRAFDFGRFSGQMYAADGSPLLPTYLIYFVGLFAVLRWWTQTDPLRKARFSPLATSACVLWAWIMHMFCQFPQPWGLMLAATISVSVQLSSAWLAPKQRALVGQSYREA